MNAWPLSPSRRAARSRTRGIAAFVALMLVASNALATMGLCVVKAPVAAAPIEAVMDAGDAPCPGHASALAIDSTAQEPSAVAAHCTQDDPGAQARDGDEPPAAFDALPVFQRHLAAASPRTIAHDRPDESPPASLHERRSRLLL